MVIILRLCLVAWKEKGKERKIKKIPPPWPFVWVERKRRGK